MSIKIIYTGAFRFPNLDAAALRVQQVGNCLSNEKYEIEYLSWADGDPEEKLKYQNYTYRNMGEFRVKNINLISRVFGFLFRGYKTAFWLFKNARKSKISIVVLYNPPAIFSLSIHMLSFLYRFKVVLDVTEWYESEHLIGGKFGLAAFENAIRMRFVYKLFKNILCISTYLQNYYLKDKSVNRNIIVIPALSKIYKTKHECFEPIKKINLIYAGNPGKKDNLKEMILSLEQLNSKLNFKVTLDLYGPSVTDIKNMLTETEMLAVNKYLYIHGNVSNNKVIEAYEKATFSILFRENKRYALAGFPTKAVESWAAGVPIITNAVGDLKRFCNNDNSIIVENNLTESLYKKLKNLDSNRLSEMRKSAYSTAKENFTVQTHYRKINAFFDKVLS